MQSLLYCIHTNQKGVYKMKTIGKKKIEWFPMKSDADAYVCALHLMGYSTAKVDRTDSGWWAIRGELVA